jgi:hypothetical protein
LTMKLLDFSAIFLEKPSTAKAQHISILRIIHTN